MNSKEQSTPIDREHDALQKEFESLLKEHDLYVFFCRSLILYSNVI